MHFQAEAWALYGKSLNLGIKSRRKSEKEGTEPYLKVLDSILDENMVAGRINLGTLNIPTDKIVGISDETDKELYAEDFMPLSSVGSPFSDQWCKHYLHYLSDRGLHRPVTCYEYLGEFYVLDGKKRVSVAKSHGAPTIAAEVIRILPVKTEEEAVKRYYEFLECFEKTQLYQICFTESGSFPKFQKALGYEEDHVWDEADRFGFLFNWYAFDHAYQEAFGGHLKATTADALMVLLEEHSYGELKDLPSWKLTERMRNAWKKLYKISSPDFTIGPVSEEKDAS